MSSNSKLAFKLAQSSDLERLMAYMEDFHNFDHAEPFDREPAKAAMEKVVSDNNIGRVWLIEQNNSPVGYMVLTLAYRLEYRGYYGFVDELYVQADRRGQGIGTAALLFIKQVAADLNIEKIQLEVKQNNLAASELYRKVGFRQLARDLLIRDV